MTRHPPSVGQSNRYRPPVVQAPAFPHNESARLASLQGYHILDTLPEADFDDIARFAANICDTPISLISLIDTDRQWFKARIGITLSETPRDAVCAHAIIDPTNIMVVPDVLADDSFATNPLVSADPYVRFYAGVPIVTPDGHALGTLCVLDRIPRTLTEDQLSGLRALGRQVTAQLELRRRLGAETITSAQEVPGEETSARSRTKTRPFSTPLFERLRPRTLLAALAAIIVTTVVLQIGDGSGPTMIFSDACFVVFSGIAGLSCLQRSRRVSLGAEGWRWLGIACLVWCAGAVAWAYFGITRNNQYPFPSVADLGFVGYVLPALIGLWFLRGTQQRKATWIWLDGGTIAAAVLFISWATVLGPMYNGPASSTFVRIVSLSYPIVDVTVLSVILALGMRQAVGSRLPWGLLGSGFAVLAITDSTYTYRQLNGGYEVGHLFDVGWVVAFILIAVAATVTAPSACSTREHRVSAVQELIPYIPIAIAIIIAVGSGRVGPHSAPFLFWFGILAFVLFAARQVVVIIDRTGLSNDLEGYVASRTAELTTQKQFLKTILDNLEEGVFACDVEGNITLFNNSMNRLYGEAPRPAQAALWPQYLNITRADGEPMERESLPLRRALRGETLHDAEFAMTPPGQTPKIMSANGRPITGIDGEITGAVLAVRDITDRLRARRALERQALRDELTGLGNRASFNQDLSGILTSIDHPDFAVLLLDLDDFKRVNDTLGHIAGDTLLIEVGNRLRACLRDGDTVSRLGGDEFTVVLLPSDETQAAGLAARILEEIAAPMLIEGTDVHISASIGIVVNHGPDTPIQLLRAADLAMYVAKTSGKASFAMFDPEMEASAAEALSLESDLRRSLRDSEVHVLYQPVVNLFSGHVTGVEALLRWKHPERGWVAPADFIPMAEHSGLILPLGEWVLGEACRQLAQWDHISDANHARISMAVNVSLRQLARPGLIQVVKRALEDSGIAPERVVLEITETALLEDNDTILRLRELHDLGLKISIDDFGTGYSSLARLRTCPVDFLKLDRSFVAEVVDDASDVPILRATVAMAGGLGLGVVAEGIETAAQFNYLRRLGCHEGQGYLMSYPVPAAEIDVLLRENILLAPSAKLPEDAVNEEMLEGLISAAISPAVSLNAFVRPLLETLERLSGVESTYLTRIHWEMLEMEITYSHNAGAIVVSEGLVSKWSETLCCRALAGGPSNISDVPNTFPDSRAAAQLGLITHFTVPIEVEPGVVFGTLCGGSSYSQILTDADMAVVRVFAQLIAEKLRQEELP